MTQIPEDYHPQPDCLKDKVILITGAGQGIGAAAARSYAKHGATVVLLDKDVPALEKLYDEIEAAGYPQPALYPMDLEGAKDTDYADLASTLQKEFGRLDGLLHNAARRDPFTALWKIDLDDWYEIMQVNLHAPYLLTRACLELLNTTPNSSIVFTTDHQSRQHDAYWGAYGVSKHALDGLMLTLADELENQSPIRVNAIDPGATKTSMRVKSFPGIKPDDMAPPENLKDTYMYLMSDDSVDHNGKVFLAQANNPA